MFRAKTDSVKKIEDGTKVDVAISCVNCNKQFHVITDTEGYRNFILGKTADMAFPDLCKADQDLLVSGMCKSCSDSFFDALGKREEGLGKGEE